MKKVAVLITILWLAMLAAAQQPDFYIGGNYGLPQYDALFDQGFEGRLGLQARVRIPKSDRFRVGFEVGYQNFQPLRDNFTQVTEARAYWVGSMVTYDLAPASKNSFEPLIGITYSAINYNEGAYLGSGMGISAGLQYLYYVQKEYGLELAVLFKNIFDRFGGPLTTSTAGAHQIVDIRLGITIPFSTAE